MRKMSLSQLMRKEAQNWSNLCGVLHGGRTESEESHIKKTLKRVGVKIDLILRANLVRKKTK